MTVSSACDGESALSFEDRPILLLFSDDSTLFFARRMRECLRSTDPELKIEMGWVVGENALSYRQMSQLLPEGPDHALHGKTALQALMRARSHRAILTSRIYGQLGAQLRHTAMQADSERPCVIAFLGGLDFTPRDGFFRRRNCDGVFVLPHREVAEFKRQAKGWPNRMWQEVHFGHPSFLAPTQVDAEALAKRRDIYFFPQALSPSTRRGRVHMLRAMAAIARANPERTVWIKLRHLPDENREHLHLEKYDYPGLLVDLSDVPENLKMTACTMDEALETAALGITCTSTAAVDIVRAGVPCMVHLDFVDNFLDPLVEPMRKLFQSSGLITSLEDMLHLRAGTPDPDWVRDMFCDRDLGKRVLGVIDRFHQRPFQVQVRWPQ